jgi:hypothetical protein
VARYLVGPELNGVMSTEGIAIVGNRTSIDLRTLPSSTESIVYLNGGLFPVADRAANGTIAVVTRGGAGHIGLPGRLDVQWSRDGGRTFSPPATVVNTAIDDRNAAFGFTPAGTLIMIYFRQSSYDETGKYTPGSVPVTMAITRSLDQGMTWSVPVVQPGFDELVGSPYGRVITLPDGSIGWNLYKMNDSGDWAPGAYLVVSHDDGVSWERPRLIAPDRNETALRALPNGELIAGTRMNDRDKQSLAFTRSADNGHTWTPLAEVTGVMQHPADFVLLGGNRVLLTYGNRQSPYRVEGRLSDDGGVTWRDETILVSGQLYGYDTWVGRKTDLGYPSSVVNGDRVTTFYYYNPDHQQTDRDWTGPTTTPFYQARGYRCIALSWSIEEFLAAVG